MIWLTQPRQFHYVYATQMRVQIITSTRCVLLLVRQASKCTTSMLTSIRRTTLAGAQMQLRPVVSLESALLSRAKTHKYRASPDFAAITQHAGRPLSSTCPVLSSTRSDADAEYDEHSFFIESTTTLLDHPSTMAERKHKRTAI